MGSMYFSLKNNRNTKKHIEKIKELIKYTIAKMEVCDYETFSSIRIDNMGLNSSHIMSFMQRDYTDKLCLKIYNDKDRDNEVSIPLKDIDTIYTLG